MQILLSTGREHGETDGLSLIDGEVLHLNDVGCRSPTPHIGWNEVDIKKKNYFDNIPDRSNFYFVNSYAANVKKDEDLIATTNYDINFTSVICREKYIWNAISP